MEDKELIIIKKAIDWINQLVVTIKTRKKIWDTKVEDARTAFKNVLKEMEETPIKY